MSKLYSLGLAFFLAFTVTGCELYFGEDHGADPGPGRGECRADGYYVDGYWVSADCPGGGNECATNDDCAAGCYCVVPDGASGGTCEEAGFCSTNDDCADGYICDERSSCVPDENAASCNAPLAPTCTNGAPTCPAGSVPLIANGCYIDTNGDGQFDCSPIASCDVAPSCSAFQYATDCDAADSCTVVTKGIDCTTNDGSACQDGQPGCVCSRYVYDSCR